MEQTPEARGGTLSTRVAVDGSGEIRVATGLAVLDHLVELLAAYAGFDLQIEVAPGGPDEEANAAGRALGDALRDIVHAKDAKGYGSAIIPADEALAHVALEASGRPLFVANVDFSDAHVAGLDRDLVSGFLRELAEGAGLTMHVRLLHGEDAAHVLEAIFKALGGALAVAAAPRKE